MMVKKILSVSAGLSLLVLLFVGNMFGILTDKQEDSVLYISEAGSVNIELTVKTGSDKAIHIVPNKITTLNIEVTNTGTKDSYIFIKLDIPKINENPILAIATTGNWQIVEKNG